MFDLDQSATICDREEEGGEQKGGHSTQWSIIGGFGQNLEFGFFGQNHLPLGPAIFYPLIAKKFTRFKGGGRNPRGAIHPNYNFEG